MKISYTATTKTIKFTTEDKNGEQDIMIETYAVYLDLFSSFKFFFMKSDLMNHVMTLSIAVDLTHTSPVAGASILAWNQFRTSNVLTALDYGSDWILNSSTEIYICSNYDGTGAGTCDIQNLKILYRLPYSVYEMPFTNQGSDK